LQFGPRVAGLTQGLTHLFPSAEVLAAGDLADLDLPSATVKSLAALAAGIASARSCSITASDGLLGGSDSPGGILETCSFLVSMARFSIRLLRCLKPLNEGKG
jgi:hypothetical protein